MIALHSSFITRKDMDTVLGCLVTDSIGPGDYTEKLIKNGREIFEYDAAIALRSPYIALQLAIAQLGLPMPAKIGLSALAPMYQRMAIEALGHNPLYYDHDPGNGQILFGNDFKTYDAVVLFAPFGILPTRAETESLGIPSIEDLSQALGAQREGAKAGSFGNLCLYAMEQGSLIPAGGGALLFASGKKLAPIVRNISERLPLEIAMTDYNAALGLAKLRVFSDILDRRSVIEEAFRLETTNTRHAFLGQPGEGTTGRVGFPILLDSSMKDAIIHAKKNGVETAPAFEGSIVSGTYAAYDFPETHCKGAQSLARRCIQFPLHEKISSKDVGLIKKVIATLP
jgi:dTDP-4-amino-4,6-dideoxygalactose transaminase